MHEAMLKLAAVLGFSIGTCTLFWPIGFSAVKGSMKLKAKWWVFLVGYIAVIVLNSAALVAVWYFSGADPTARDGFDWVQLGILYGLPLTISTATAFALAPYQRPAAGLTAQVR